MAKIRVLIVDDSITVRKHLEEVLTADAQFEVVGEAENGQTAIELCESLRPDVITMDLVMPQLGGLAATEYIMAYCPTPILIVSSSRNCGEVFSSYDAMAAGAVDVLDKSDAGEPDGRWEQRLRASVKTVSRIKVITHPRARFARNETARMQGTTSAYRCVAIGASTGGPGAVRDLLCALPANFPLPILLVIHIGEPFGIAMSDWLNSLSPIPVATAVDGEPLPQPGKGRVIMAPHNRHLVLRGGQLWFNDAPERHSCRPAVDVLFESVASELGPAAIACLLTGIGRDGAKGMLAIHRAGGITMAQDEATSVVFGMPRAAIALGAARHILPLSEMAPTLVQLTSAKQPSGR